MFQKMKVKKATRLLKKRIGLMLDKGISKEEITQKAQKLRWTKEVIEKIFTEIEEKKKDEKEIKLKIPLLKKKKEEPIEEKPIEEKEEPKELTALEKEEPKKKGLSSQIKELNERINIISEKEKTEKKFKKKRFKVPFKVKSQLRKLVVKNKVQVLLLQRTRGIKPIIGEIRDGMLLINDMIYNGAVDATWLWNGKYPTHIVPEWDLQPLSPEGIKRMKETITLSPSELYADCIKNGRAAEPEKIIIRAIEAKENAMLKGKANVKTIILVVVITMIVAAVLFGGGVI